jgi:hypothetical protein
VENQTPKKTDLKFPEISEGLGFCGGECRFGDSPAGAVFKKKCCKKYKRKGRHCRGCPKL